MNGLTGDGNSVQQGEYRQGLSCDDGSECIPWFHERVYAADEA